MTKKINLENCSMSPPTKKCAKNLSYNSLFHQGVFASVDVGGNSTKETEVKVEVRRLEPLQGIFDLPGLHPHLPSLMGR